MNAVKKLTLFVRLGRPQVLVPSLANHCMGAICAVRAGATFSPLLFLLGQVYVWNLQVMTHYCCEYFDLASDRLNESRTGWTGGSRVLVEGHFKPSVALYTAVLLGCVGVAMQLLIPFGIPEFARARVPALIALALAWQYAGRPLKLHYRGFGAFTVAAITALLPFSGFLLQRGAPTEIIASGQILGRSHELGLALVPIFLLTVARSVLMDIPDVEADKAAGKYTMAVRMGIPNAVKLYVALQVISYGLAPLLWRLGLPGPVVIVLLLSAPLGIWPGIRLLRGDWKSPERLRDIPALCAMQGFTVDIGMPVAFLLS